MEALFEQVGDGGSGNAAEVALRYFLNLEFSKKLLTGGGELTQGRAELSALVFLDSELLQHLAKSFIFESADGFYLGVVLLPNFVEVLAVDIVNFEKRNQTLQMIVVQPN